MLAYMASKNLVRVYMSVGSLDGSIARTLEPRASAPGARLNALRKLAPAGIPTGMIVAPVIPALTDHALEKLLFSAKHAGSQSATYVLPRLPLEQHNSAERGVRKRK